MVLFAEYDSNYLFTHLISSYYVTCQTSLNLLFPLIDYHEFWKKPFIRLFYLKQSFIGCLATQNLNQFEGSIFDLQNIIVQLPKRDPELNFLKIKLYFELLLTIWTEKFHHLIPHRLQRMWLTISWTKYNHLKKKYNHLLKFLYWRILYSSSFYILSSCILSWSIHSHSHNVCSKFQSLSSHYSNSASFLLPLSISQLPEIGTN